MTGHPRFLQTRRATIGRMPHDHHEFTNCARHPFQTTRWSLVLSAASPSSPGAHQALCELCEKYWYPVYVYVRRRVSSVEEAQDLTQAFFAKLLEKNYVAQADPQRGRFRTFLLSSLSHFLANAWDRSHAKKRGGDCLHFSLDLAAGENRLSHEPSTDLTAEREFEQKWAISILQQTMQVLRQKALARGTGKQFEELKDCLSGNDRRTYAEIARRLDISESAVKVAVHRLRQQYGLELRQLIAETVSDPAEVDEEIRRLFEALS